MSVDIPFPVEVPYAMRPHMRPWQPGEPILIADHQIDQYIKEKTTHYDPVYGDNVSAELIQSAISSLRKYDSSCPIKYGETDGLVYKLTLQIQEDFVIFAPNKRGELSAQVLSVHLPSGWDPAEKANLSFRQIHEPVAGGELIIKASEHIANMICTKGPFVRHVWSISSSGSLSQHPKIKKPWADQTIDDMWYRCERQVTIPIDGIASLFLIRVFMQPLSEIFDDQLKRQKIIDSVNSMTDAVLDYKGFAYLKDYFNRHCV